ncbi:fibrobacter succinogenes major paralogous domain-containing protein [Flavobacterium sp. CYK-55]|uniref:fibrobacter succinogenes major paralogous domain-containing protein n=1 Tax=Flavobacterium sp. CYK-55 TaxID=2835529 RepID=UPI001BD0C906|nr:fibrobacter succinogenes major paralogous domain-containing protein [Flavobacterium sp. CYK-55]MBS7786570.1 fibrobacter succinogenes major paralogous domain-containing protein [Flavobacterium sp. CYK-55]
MKNYFSATLIFCLVIVVISCSQQEDNKSQTQPASRPSVPVQAAEVQIGNQIWMTKNLNVSRYKNGDIIPQVQDPSQWTNLTSGAWCYYQNNTANGIVYGKLYNWYAVNDPRGLAPTGYHVPSDAEWTTLTTFLGGEALAGNKMKATTGWATYPGITNTNSSGFTGLPGGFRYDGGTFFSIGYDGTWWSSSEYSTTNAWGRGLNYYYSSAGRGYTNKIYGFSVRCLRD